MIIITYDTLFNYDQYYINIVDTDEKVILLDILFYYGFIDKDYNMSIIKKAMVRYAIDKYYTVNKRHIHSIINLDEDPIEKLRSLFNTSPEIIKLYKPLNNDVYQIITSSFKNVNILDRPPFTIIPDKKYTRVKVSGQTKKYLKKIFRENVNHTYYDSNILEIDNKMNYLYMNEANIIVKPVDDNTIKFNYKPLNKILLNSGEYNWSILTYVILNFLRISQYNMNEIIYIIYKYWIGLSYENTYKYVYTMMVACRKNIITGSAYIKRSFRGLLKGNKVYDDWDALYWSYIHLLESQPHDKSTNLFIAKFNSFSDSKKNGFIRRADRICNTIRDEI